MERATLSTDRTPAESWNRPDSGLDRHPPRVRPPRRSARSWIASILLLVFLGVIAAGLAWWKARQTAISNAAAASQPEPVEAISVATAIEREHRPVTISIGTVLALRSTTLRNELAGTVREVHLTPGKIVEEGELLVALDVSVEEAELAAMQAQAALAETLMRRMERAVESRATSQMELDRARAEYDVAMAHIARIEAIIARKTIRAPFRARLGISDLHPGQYLQEGTLLTTLQGVDEGAHVDFAVPQHIAQGLRDGDTVEIVTTRGQQPVTGRIVALDARVDPATRNTTVRAFVADDRRIPPPGASVRVRVPASEPLMTVSIPASALRKGPGGDHVFVISEDATGKPRAQMRRVQVGATLGDEVLVASGLSPGENVAAFGSFKLREGVLVAITGAPASAELN